MARSKPATSPPAPSTPEPLADLVRTLTGQVEALARHVDALYRILDDIREDFGYAMQNGRLGPRGTPQGRPVVHVTSMPKDPCAPDWGERLNRFSAKNLPADATQGQEARNEAGGPEAGNPGSARQGELWEE